jgi:signal transduction histidine kinase
MEMRPDEKGLMSAQSKTEAAAKIPQEAAKIPQEINTRLRSLAHDLSNSVETIMQASYLLAQSNLDENAKKWAELIDKASRDCAKINRDIRDILKASA